jgi:hypothetical protein
LLPQLRPVVLHAAISLLEQAIPQTLYTQVVNYNAPLKHYNLKDLYLQYLGMWFIWFAKLRGIVLNFGA